MEDSRENFSFYNKIINAEYFALGILIIVSALCRAPLIFEGFPMFDAASIAVSIIDFIHHGHGGNFTQLYFLDVIPGYVLYIKIFMKILNNNYAYLTSVMNYTNAVAGTLMIVPCYYFVHQLLNNRSIAFSTTLTFIFVPSVFRLSIFGLPPLLPLFFFITSLYFFLVWLDNEKHTWLVLSFITLTATIFFKADFVLGIGAYLGLLYMRGTKEKNKLLLTFCSIALSIFSFMLLRDLIIGHQYKGPDLGSTTSISSFIEWGERFFTPLYSQFQSKNYTLIIRSQIKPIIEGIGVVSFFPAGFAFLYYLLKRRYNILFLVVSWSAMPTVLWLIMWPNSQRHNMLSVLPFLIIIFVLIYEKAPRIILLFSLLFVAGNFLLASPAPSTHITGVNFIDNQLQLRNEVNRLHSVAKGITHVNDNKIIFSTPSLKPYLLYELFTSMPGYNTEQLDASCYRIGKEQCIVCFNVTPDKVLSVVKKYYMEKDTIIAPSFNLHFLKEEGFNVIDNSDIQSLMLYERDMHQLMKPFTA